MTNSKHKTGLVLAIISLCLIVFSEFATSFKWNIDNWDIVTFLVSMLLPIPCIPMSIVSLAKKKSKSKAIITLVIVGITYFLILVFMARHIHQGPPPTEAIKLVQNIYL